MYAQNVIKLFNPPNRFCLYRVHDGRTEKDVVLRHVAGDSIYGDSIYGDSIYGDSIYRQM